MLEFPPHVVDLREALRRDPSDVIGQLAVRLIDSNNPEHERMWRTLYRNRHPFSEGNEYVWAFLRTCQEASNLPAHHPLSQKERRQLGVRIEQLASKLANSLSKNGLDSNLVAAHGKVFHGFYFYEDFSDSNRFRIDKSGDPKIQSSRILKAISDRAIRELSMPAIRGKKGIGQAAVLFMRHLRADFKRSHGAKLNDVIAVATNSIFGTHYRKGDVANIDR